MFRLLAIALPLVLLLLTVRYWGVSDDEVRHDIQLGIHELRYDAVEARSEGRKVVSELTRELHEEMAPLRENYTSFRKEFHQAGKRETDELAATAAEAKKGMSDLGERISRRANEVMKYLDQRLASLGAELGALRDSVRVGFRSE